MSDTSSIAKPIDASDAWNITYTLSGPDADKSASPTLCLNMIVKNESKIITRLLNSVAPWIDSYCICDTGSTDNTIELIETFFKTRNIPGKIVNEPFQDFGYNRSFALRACTDVPKSDFVLLLDADMIFHVNPALTPTQFKSQLAQSDAHYIFQGSETFYYKNTRIVRNRMGMSYWGVTHEYVQVPPNTVYHLISKEDAFINDIGDGGSKADKFLRDIRLLKKGLETLPNNDRYTFYLANSLKDSGQLDEAIETYRKRIQIGGWIEEIWFSHFNIGHCYKRKGDMANAIQAWMDAYQTYPDRIENLYEIINHYRMAGKNRLAYPFYVLAKNELNKKHRLEYLFMQKDVYDYKVDYEMTIMGYYCNTDKIDLCKLSMDVLKYPHLETSISKNVMSNYKFYAKSIIKDWPETAIAGKTDTNSSLIKALKSVGQIKMQGETDFVSSSPALLKLSADDDPNIRYAVNVRYVNYSIGDKGEYIQKSNIETRNILATVSKDETGSWTVSNENFIQHDTTLDAFYVGIEDVRLFRDNTNPSMLMYNGNRGLPGGNMEVEVGSVNLETGETIPPRFPHIPDQGRLEKNWVLLPVSANQTTKIIYGWSPLLIGDIVQDETDPKITNFVKTHEYNTPQFFKHLRGSTNGLVIDDEIWFICHSVSYEDRRYYYHLVVALDRETFALKRYTPFFTIEKEKVEYTLGFTYNKMADEFLIGYSIMDRRTEYVVVPKSRFDGMLLNV